MLHHLLAGCAAAAVLAASAGAGGDTLATVQARGTLLCGVNEGLPGFSAADAGGAWSGLDVDLCRAIGAAVLGNAGAVTYVPLTARDRFAALGGGEVDVLIRNTTWTFTRDSELAVNFAGVNYYDGQGFLTRRDSRFASVMDLDGASVCVTRDTTTERNLADWFSVHGLRYTVVPFVRLPEMYAAYEAGFCDALTADQSGLAANRPALGAPDAHRILPEVISKEALGPVVRHGDDRWLDIVRWTLNAMIAAEELGLGSRNVARVRAGSARPEVRRLLGVEGRFGAKLGLDAAWAYEVIAQVGSYGESFRRNLGADSAIKLPRGLNALWTEGGLMYAMPFR